MKQRRLIAMVMVVVLTVLGAFAVSRWMGAGASEVQTEATPLPYADDFANPESGWQMLNDPNAEVKYEQGKLNILVKQASITQWSLANKNFSDAAFEVDAMPLGGPRDNGFGILYRVKDRKNFYFFAISSDGSWQNGISEEGKWKPIQDWQAHPAIQPDTAANKIRVEMKGDTFTLFVNGQQITQQKDAQFGNGDIGVFAITLYDQPGTHIAFDNAQVLALNSK